MRLKYRGKYWCWWLRRHLWYNGRAFNAKDYEFVDATDCVVTLNKEQVDQLKEA